VTIAGVITTGGTVVDITAGVTTVVATFVKL
jgi:hypothetical protein